ncbi:anaerobic ribonucleoside-triphosphate reductase activating protein [Eubacteriales bacterium OttesenSCG-928-M02]|nr:anaerobic ribonucleoside-triphosphate reductase activating protein [Eubacteriales bacterium OttesenSCG-928-M02]
MCNSSIQRQPIKVAGSVQDSIVDGPGLRYALFTQGCPHHCPGCHNPETLPFTGGTPMLAEEIFLEIRKNPLLTGVTLSGGEPFAQAGALLPLAEMVKEKGYELAIYTGYTFEALVAHPEEDMRRLLLQADVLIDGPFLQTERDLTLRFRGSKNQRMIDVGKSAPGCIVLVTDPRWMGEE